jgi:hypothetical protein
MTRFDLHQSITVVALCWGGCIVLGILAAVIEAL